ncbi:MAG: glycosyltransferase family 25 protein, partial [Hyphomicrobium sp.]
MIGHGEGQRMWVFVINLDRDRERLERMVGECQRVGLTFERFAAVDGNRLEPDLRDQFYDGDILHEPAFTPGEIGVYASHLRILRLLESRDGEYALIFEDDVRLAEDLVPTIQAAVAAAKDWDIIRLSNATKSVFKPVAQLGGGRELAKYWTVPNSAGAYLISRTGAIKFANGYDKRTMPIDEDLRRPWQTGLVTYGVLPPPVEPDVLEGSTIDSMGRDRKLSARSRFKDAAPWRDVLARLRYRLETFGALDFARGLAQSLAASAVKKIRGRKAAAKLYRL